MSVNKILSQGPVRGPLDTLAQALSHGRSNLPVSYLYEDENEGKVAVAGEDQAVPLLLGKQGDHGQGA